MKKPSLTAVRKRLTGMFALPPEVTLNLPLVSLVGSGELSVENYKGIIEYTPERLRVRTAAGILRLSGKRLTLKRLTAESLLVRGVIETVEYTQ